MIGEACHSKSIDTILEELEIDPEGLKEEKGK
jgi:hypothetical protein